MKKVFNLSVLLLLLTACGSESIDDRVIGKWRPLVDDGRVLEFTADGYYNLFVGGMNIFQNIEGYGRIKYKFEAKSDGYTLLLMDENLKNEFVKGELQLSDSGQLSIAFYQNNGELNAVETYVRADQ